MKFLQNLFTQGPSTGLGLPPKVRKGLHATWSFLAGLAAALILSYVLYRVALPSKPFIYVSF